LDAVSSTGEKVDAAVWVARENGKREFLGTVLNGKFHGRAPSIEWLGYPSAQVIVSVLPRKDRSFTEQERTVTVNTAGGPNALRLGTLKFQESPRPRFTRLAKVPVTGHFVSTKDGEKKPLSGVTVIIRGNDGRELGRGVSDAHGDVSVSVPPGEHKLEVQPPAGSSLKLGGNLTGSKMDLRRVGPLSLGEVKFFPR